MDYAVIYLDTLYNASLSLGLKENFFGSANLQTAGTHLNA